MTPLAFNHVLPSSRRDLFAYGMSVRRSLDTVRRTMSHDREMIRALVLEKQRVEAEVTARGYSVLDAS